MKDKLNIGCGNKTRKGYINLDYNTKAKGIDVTHDLNKIPYPFKDNQFKEVVAENILEHLKDLESVMKEFSRICKNKAVIKIIVPHYNHHMAYTDTDHKRYFTPDTFNKWQPTEVKFSYLHDEEYRIKKIELIPDTYIILGLIITPLRFLPQGILRMLSYFIGNISREIYFELEVIK